MTDIFQKMKILSPKFIPRESMLVKSYDLANNNDFSIIHELQKLFETPYDEHIDDGMTEKYYMKRKENNSCGINRGNSFIS